MSQCRRILVFPHQDILSRLEASSRSLVTKGPTTSNNPTGEGQPAVPTIPQGKQPVSRGPHVQLPPPKESQSFMMNLFRGVIQTNEVFPYPDVLTAQHRETLVKLIEPVERFFVNVNNASQNDEDERIADQSLDALWEMGLFGLNVPQDLGGLGLTHTQYARLVEIIGGKDLSVAMTLGAHQSIGFKGILLVGTHEQKAKYLPRVTQGKEFAAFCLTEPTAGSDAGSIRMRALLSDDGKHYVLNGTKLWISNGGICEIMTVFAQTPVLNKLGNVVDRVTAFIVERGFGGVTSGQPQKKMGIKASNTTDITFENVKVPVENVLGEVGGGFKVAMNILNNGRFSTGAALSGTMKHVIQQAVTYAKSRIQFGSRIDSYGTIQEKIARMSLLHYVAESMTYMVSGNMDSRSTEYHMEAAITKVFASEAAWSVADEAVQIMGGMGYMRDSGLERVLRDLRVFRIFEGTNEILRLFVALSGIQYAGTHSKEIQKAFESPAVNMGLIFGLAKSHLIYTVGLSTPPSMYHHVHPALKDSSTEICKSVERFGRTVESVMLKHGKAIVEQQFILNRIASAAVDIYASVAVLSRATDSLNKNLASAKHEMLMTQVWCSQAHRRISKDMKEVFKQKGNFKKMARISRHVCDARGPLQRNPLGF